MRNLLVTIDDFAGAPLSLFQFNNLVKETLAEGFPDRYWVVAEIAKISEKGHCYLELVEKDEAGTHAQARATIWSNKLRKITARFEQGTGKRLQAGIKILFQATLQFHELYGMSLEVCDIDPRFTVGELARQRRDILARLEAEGLLTRNAQLALPLAPQRLAVVSSATAAGYQDFVHQLASNPDYGFSVTLFAATVQGNDAPASVVAALLAIADRLAQDPTAFDAVVIIRGGGAQTDLSCFDSYAIAAQVAQMPVPVLTGIGHERDETITDLAAHTRLKTPTAVAGFLIDACRAFEQGLDAALQLLLSRATGRLATASERLEHHALTLYRAAGHTIHRQQQRTDRHAHALARQAERQLAQHRQSLAHLTDTTQFAVNNRLQKEGSLLSMSELKLRLLDPKALVQRGLSRTYHNGRLLRSLDQVRAGDVIETRLANGSLQSLVITLG